jgi:hypothetical protein
MLQSPFIRWDLAMSKLHRSAVGLLLIVLAVWASACDRKEDVTKLSPVAGGTYQVGQRWQYKTRPGEPRSTLIVVGVEQNPQIGQIVHVRVEDVAMKDPRTPTGATSVLNHLPFTKAALDLSATAKVEEGLAPSPESQAAYLTWKAAFQAGNADVWPVPVSEVVDIIERSINGAPPPQTPAAGASGTAAPASPAAPGTAVAPAAPAPPVRTSTLPALGD